MTLTLKTSTFTTPRSGLAAALILLLAACGGGGGGGIAAGGAVILDPLDAATNAFVLADGAITAQVLTPSTNSVSTQTGTVDAATSIVTAGDLSGVADFAAGTVAIDGGGLAIISSDGTQFVGRFDASPQGDTRSFGVVGLATEAANLPAGSASYAGSTNVNIVDGTDIYDLTGTLDLDIAFDATNPTVSTTLDALSGTVTDAVSAPVAVADAAQITITGSALDGAGFAGGTTTLTSDSITPLTDDATTALTGGFYGPNAEEVGGVGIINSAADITFDFIGRR